MFHYIKSGDTLAGLSKEIGLENPVYLKEYNNAQCLPADIITEELEPGKRVLIPKLTEIEQYNALKDAPFRLPEANPQLKWKPVGRDCVYRVSVENRLDGQSTGAFQYHSQLRHRKSGYGYHLYSWQRSNYRFHASTKMSQLAQACSEAINPLILTLNDNGDLEEISADKQVLERWPEIEAALRDAFPDAYAAAYIEDLGYVLHRSHVVNSRMRQDPFIKTYFARIRTTFDKGFARFPLQWQPGAAPLLIQQQVDRLDYTDTIPLRQTLEVAEGSHNSGFYYQGMYNLQTADSSIRTAAVHTRQYLSGRQQETSIELEEQ